MKRTADLIFTELCDEIDFWKAEAEHYKGLYEKERQENSRVTNERLQEAKRGVAQALMFSLSVREGEDGSLVIPKEQREGLKESF